MNKLDIINKIKLLTEYRDRVKHSIPLYGNYTHHKDFGSVECAKLKTDSLFEYNDRVNGLSEQIIVNLNLLKTQQLGLLDEMILGYTRELLKSEEEKGSGA